jgi:tetrahydromethanopterin S-methyltransferase subunit G
MASQGDVQDIKRRLDEVNQRLAALQKTLDEIVVEIDAA